MIDIFHVCENIATDCLVDRDFLKKYNAVLIIVNNVLVLTDDELMSQHELVDKDYNTKPISATISRSHVIPARMQYFIPYDFNLEQCDLDEDMAACPACSVYPF